MIGWRRVVVFALSGWLALWPVQYAIAASCNVVLSKALQGVQEKKNGNNTGAFFTQNNSSSRIHNVVGQQFDFARVNGWLTPSGCNDGSGNEFQCQISGDTGVRGNPVPDIPQNNQSDSINAYGGITAYLGVPEWLAPFLSDDYLVNSDHRYKDIDVGGTVYFWGGPGANENSKGYIEYSVDRVNLYGGVISVPPGDFLVAKSFEIPGGSFEPQGDERPDGWDDFLSGFSSTERAAFYDELIAQGFRSTESSSYIFFERILYRFLSITLSGLEDFLWPLDHISSTTRVRLNSDLNINNAAARMNDATGAQSKNLVVHTSEKMEMSGGVFRGSLIQTDEDSQSQNITLVMNNSSASFYGMASVEAGFEMTGGNFYYDPTVLDADFDDICDGDSADIDIELEIAREVALTCEVVDVTVRVNNGGSIYDSFEGGVNIETTSDDGNWVTAGYGLNGSVTDLGDGDIRYNFVDADNGEITIGFSHPSLGLVSMQASDENGDVFSNSDAIEFVPEALTVSFNPDEYPVANEPFELVIHAVKTSDDDPSECVSDIDYSGDKTIGLTMRYIDNELADKEVLTVAGDEVPEISSGNDLTLNVNFDGGESDPLSDVNYADVGGIGVTATDKDFDDEFPDQPPLTGEGTTTVIPYAVEFLDIRTQPDDAACGNTNLAGTASDTDKGFGAAGEPFEALISGLIANCDASGNSCNVDDVSCAAPNFKAAVSFNHELDSPTGGVLGQLTDSQIASDDFVLGSAVAKDFAYDEVGSINLQLNVSNWSGLADVNYQHELVVGRFYPAYLERTVDEVRSLPNHTPACVAGDFSYLSDPNQQISFELTAYSADGEITENYDNDSLGYVNVAEAPTYLLFDGDTELSDRLVGLPDPLTWDNGVVTVEDDSFGVARAVSPDGQFVAPLLGMALYGGDDETFDEDELDYQCGDSSCDEAAIDLLEQSLAELRYGRLVASNGYSPESLALHVPLRGEYWYDPSNLVAGDEYFTNNGDDNCTEISFADMSFSPDKSSSDEIAIGSGTSTVALTRDQSGYGQTAVMQDGRLWIRYTAPNDVGSATHYVGEGGDSLPVTSWPVWLRYDWDGDGNDDEAVNGVATFGRTRGSDRVISRREL
ncbi:hypothetical protein K0504_00250 [Neiella marina]|uniref:DUF6701 domain-containing protein n=1 Tax=Neiella holothuriorum TaxID=2870530 RepID=A0ABS7EB66_9GAMM|nr:DUF6701 domain-containing protein [Neiella holothuriorum]MBW8189449.1 hypothetical protein [Neiella holothuriorum]